MRSTVFAFMLACGIGTSAHATTYEYKVKHFPAAAGDCHQLAANLGQTIAQRTGVSVTRAICSLINDYGYTFKINYEATEPLNLVTTIPSMSSLDNGGGVFDEESDCEAALPAEITRFRSNTGLDPVVSYCTIDVFSEHPFGIQIDAFGEPTKAPKASSWHLFGKLAGITSEQLITNVRTAMTAMGFEPSYLVSKEAAGDIILSTLFYTEGARIHTLDGGNVVTSTQCSLAVSELTAAFPAANNQGIMTSFCTYDRFLDRFNINSLSIGTTFPYVTPSAERFQTYEACLTAKPLLIRNYIQLYQRPVVAGVCAVTSAGWAVNLFERRN